MKRTIFTAAIFLAAASLAFAEKADAGACSVTDVTKNAIACFDVSGKNDANGTNGSKTLATISLLGINFNSVTGNEEFEFGGEVFPAEAWFLVDKSDDVSGNQYTFFTGDIPTAKTGTLTFKDNLFGFYALTLKAGKGYSAYLLDLEGDNSVSYTINKGLSHASLWTYPGGFNSGCGGEVCAPVPEPATLALFGLGLAGLGFTIRRRNV